MFLWATSLFAPQACLLSRKIYTKRAENTFQNSAPPNRSQPGPWQSLDIVYSSPPSVLITLLNSRFRNARLFFAHCLISCRGIMEVGTAYQYTSLNPSRHLPDFERLIMTRHQVTLPGPGHTAATTRCYPQLKLANIIRNYFQ